MAWIANSESGLSIRAKLNSLLIPISSDAISSPVAYYDLALPAGYLFYQLKFGSIGLSANDNLVVAMSADGGTSFINDVDAGDSYAWREILAYYGTDGTGSQYTKSQPESDGTFPVSTTNGSGSSERHYGMIEVWPGSVSEFATILTHCVSWDQSQDASKISITNEAGGPNPLATITPTMQRINLLRFTAQTGGAVNPPTSGKNLVSGSFILFGIPSP